MELKYFLFIIGAILAISGIYFAIKKENVANAVITWIFALLTLGVALFISPAILIEWLNPQPAYSITSYSDTPGILVNATDNDIYNSPTTTPEIVVTQPIGATAEPSDTSYNLSTHTPSKKTNTPSPSKTQTIAPSIDNIAPSIDNDIWIYFLDPMNEYKLSKMRSDGSDKSVFVDESCSEIVSIVGDTIYFREANYSFSNGEESWGPKDLCSIQKDGTNMKTIPIPNLYQICLISDNQVFYQNGADNLCHSINIDGTNDKTLDNDVLYADYVVGNKLYCTDLTDNWSLYVLDMSSQLPKQKISSRTFYVDLYQDDYLYMTEVLWTENHIGNSWQYGGIYKLDVINDTISDLGYNVENVVRVISIEDGYIYFSTDTSIQRMNLSNGKIDTIVNATNEVFSNYKDWLYYNAFAYDKDGNRYPVGTYIVRKDGSENIKIS